jgi:cell division protein FtsN
VSAPTNDEGFREIQLNGKQLVFLFMAATVVSVVIFLCGVLVGRGVRPDRAPAQEVATAEIAADPGAAQPPATQTATPPATEPPAPPDELTYAERLQKDTPPQETLKPVAAAPPVPTPRPERVAPQPVKNTSARTAPATSPANAPSGVIDPSGPGFAVQVMIFDTRKEADSLAARLIAKGYPAFVMDPVKGAPRGIYRVRVGKYKNRRDAEAVSSRLETVEQFKPWIAR